MKIIVKNGTCSKSFIINGKKQPSINEIKEAIKKEFSLWGFSFNDVLLEVVEIEYKENEIIIILKQGISQERQQKANHEDYLDDLRISGMND